MTMVVWLFVAIIIIQSYTASLTTMLTIPHIQSNDYSIEYLKRIDAKVGCDTGSFVEKYLEDVFGILPKNIRSFDSYTDYPQALEKGEIAAAILVAPNIKVFMAEHCKNFIVVGPIYEVGGFGFVFPKGSPILPDISKAILELKEGGELLKLETAMLSKNNCSDSDSPDGSLGVPSFSGLFYITGGTTTITLVLYLLRSFISSNHLEKSKYFKVSKRTSQLRQGEHDPGIDERYMFEAEMGNYCLDLRA